MAKNKHPKLPNGFGSIKKLSGNRSNPYAVYPPVTKYNEKGNPITPSALCYVPDWYTGFYALMEYKNGNFDASKFTRAELKENDKKDSVILKIISAYNNNQRLISGEFTFKEVFESYYAYKYERENGKKYSISSMRTTKSAYENCKELHNRVFSQITAVELQSVIDDCPLKHATKELILTLLKQMYKYAYTNNMCERDYSSNLRINTEDDDIKGVPFSEKEIETLWKNKDDEFVCCTLIMIYSGFRVSEYPLLEVDFENKVFKGGLKTDNSKSRVAPFSPLIEDMIDLSLPLFSSTYKSFYPLFMKKMNSLGMGEHTPHDCRHTFSWLCDTYKVDTLSKKLMLGHSLGSDVTDARYGHRTIEQLRQEISKIKRQEKSGIKI